MVKVSNLAGKVQAVRLNEGLQKVNLVLKRTYLVNNQYFSDRNPVNVFPALGKTIL
jgi:hypothetical protein